MIISQKVNIEFADALVPGSTRASADTMMMNTNSLYTVSALQGQWWLMWLCKDKQVLVITMYQPKGMGYSSLPVHLVVYRYLHQHSNISQLLKVNYKLPIACSEVLMLSFYPFWNSCHLLLWMKMVFFLLTFRPSAKNMSLQKKILKWALSDGAEWHHCLGMSDFSVLH